MLIDEKKIREKSLEGNVGPKKMIPVSTRFKRARTPAERRMEFARLAIGFCLTAGFAAAVVMLVYSLVDGGVEYGRTLGKRNAPAKSQYVEVIFKPKSASDVSK